MAHYYVNLTNATDTFAPSTLLPSSVENNNDDGDRDENLARIEVTVLAVILVTTVLGNAAVILALWQRRRRHGARKKSSRMYFFILHLSVADLLTAALSVAPQLAWDVTYRFRGGPVLCKLIKFGQTLGPYSSSYVLTATAIDRHCAICRPLTYCSSSRRARTTVRLAWFLSLSFCVPQLFIFSYQEVEPDVFDCWATFSVPWGERAYVTWYCISIFIVPLLVLIVTYSCICREIWKSAVWTPTRNNNNNNNHRNACVVVAANDNAAPTTEDERHLMHVAAANNGRKKKKWGHKEMTTSTKKKCTGLMSQRTNGGPNSKVPLISRAKINTIKQTVAVVVVYICCTAPFVAAQLWATWDPSAANSSFANGSVFTIVALLYSLNSCANPWIYLAFNRELSRTLLRHYSAFRSWFLCWSCASTSSSVARFHGWQRRSGSGSGSCCRTGGVGGPGGGGGRHVHGDTKSASTKTTAIPLNVIVQ